MANDSYKTEDLNDEELRDNFAYLNKLKQNNCLRKMAKNLNELKLNYNEKQNTQEIKQMHSTFIKNLCLFGDSIQNLFFNEKPDYLLLREYINNCYNIFQDINTNELQDTQSFQSELKNKQKQQRIQKPLHKNTMSCHDLQQDLIQENLTIKKSDDENSITNDKLINIKRVIKPFSWKKDQRKDRLLSAQI